MALKQVGDTVNVVAFDILSRKVARPLSALDQSVIDARSLFTGKAGYRQFGFVELLTPDGYNPKTKKGRARGYSTAIMHFAPAELLRLQRVPRCDGRLHRIVLEHGRSRRYQA